MKNTKIILSSFAIASFALLPAIGFADVAITNPIGGENGSDSLEEFILKIAKFLFNIALVLAPIMFVIGGLYYITAQGDPAKIKKAGDLIIWTAIGLIVIMITTGIIQLLKDMIE